MQSFKDSLLTAKSTSFITTTKTTTITTTTATEVPPRLLGGWDAQPKAYYYVLMHHARSHAKGSITRRVRPIDSTYTTYPNESVHETVGSPGGIPEYADREKKKLHMVRSRGE